MNRKHYVLSLWLSILIHTPNFALTLFSQQSGTWGPGGTVGLFNTAADGSGVSYDGGSTLWSNPGNDLIIQSGHIIVFRHNTFNLGNLSIESNAKLYANDIVNATNYELQLFGSNLTVKGQLGDGVPAAPGDVDRIALSVDGGTISGPGEITVRALNWNYNNPLSISTIVNVHLYDAGWQTWYLYPGFGTGAAKDLNILPDGELNIYGNFTHDYDLRFSPGAATNASDFSGKINVDGKIAVYEGNFFMRTDNSSSQNFNVFINTDGEAHFEKYLYCNRGTGDTNPYIGNGKVALSVTGMLSTNADDPVKYSSSYSVVSMRLGSTFKLGGGASQVLDSGVLDARYYNVELSGAGPKMLEADVEIDNNLLFTDTGLQLGNFNLTMNKTFAIGAINDVFQNNSDTKYIETNGSGSVKAHVPRGSFFNPGDITWPVGNGTYNELTFENYGLADYLSVKVSNQVLANGTGGTPITSLVVQKTWDIKEDVAGGQNLNIIFMWDPADESPDFNRMDCWGSHYNGSSWDIDPQGTGGATASGSSYTRRRNGVTNFSAFAVFSNAALVPVELIRFKGQPLEETILLEWQTATETDNKHFIVEHSIDGKGFLPIGILAGGGNSNFPLNYSFTHYNPINGTNYYRLKQEDYSGDFNTSPVIAIEWSRASKQLSVFPTLASASLNFSIDQPIGGPANLKIFDALGRCVQEHPLTPYSDSETLDISGLVSGTYWIVLYSKEGKSDPMEFIKK